MAVTGVLENSPATRESVSVEAGRDPEKANADLPNWRRFLVLFIVSWNTLVITSTSTSLLVATPEISADIDTTEQILNITNAGVLIAQGCASLFWSPFAALTSRRISYTLAVFTMFASSIGTAVSNDLASFTATRILTGLTGTFFMVAGQTFIADIFKPTTRGRAVGCMMVGSVAGNGFGPCIGGIVLTYSHWRSMYWLQAAEAGLGLILTVLFIPDIKSEVRQLSERPAGQKLTVLGVLSMFNPWRVFKQFLKPQILLADTAMGILVLTQYALIASVRPVINARFNLDTPLVSGLVFIAPAVGFITGCLVGGKMSDRAVKQYIAKRDGVRLPKDRLNSGLVYAFGILPISLLLFGWSLARYFGGLALPIVASFWIGAGIMGASNGLNTYTGEVRPNQRAEVVASKYALQYCFGAAGNVAVLPLLNAIGAGWMFTILTFLALVCGGIVLVIARLAPDTGIWSCCA